MSTQNVLPAETGLAMTAVTVTPNLIGIAAFATASSAACPACGTHSDRIHSHYIRTVADLPRQGRRVALRVTVRRFRCRAAGCERTVFCERLPTVLIPHARTTDRMTAAHRAIGFALGGEAGSRLAERLAAPTSPDTLLRRVRSAALPRGPVPRVLGVDDFAFRRGKSYGTILIDLERRAVVDLLPDRTAGTLASWLRQHPGVEIVSRDRASAYAQAVREAAPDATQVADRFHLLVNLREAVERSFGRQAKAVQAVLTNPATGTVPQAALPVSHPPVASSEPAESDARSVDPVSPTTHPRTARQATAEGKRRLRQERFDRVRQLHREGTSLRGIAGALKLSFLTVQRYVRAEACPGRQAGPTGRPAPSPLDPFRDRVDRAVAAGCPNARAPGLAGPWLHRWLQPRPQDGPPANGNRSPHRGSRHSSSGPFRSTADGSTGSPIPATSVVCRHRPPGASLG